MWQALQQRYRSALRYKLLVLVLLPLLLAMAASLAYTLYWLNNYTLETLHFTVRHDLALARRAMHAVQEEYQSELRRLAESVEFRAVLQRADAAGIERLVRRTRETKGFVFLHVTGVAGDWLFEAGGGHKRSSKPSPLTDRGARGIAGAALEVFRAEDLLRESPVLAKHALSPQGGEAAETEPGALMLRFVQPIHDAQGRVTMALDGAVMLNHNRTLLDAIRQHVFGAGARHAGSVPVVSLVLENKRIAAATSEIGDLDFGAVSAAVRPAPGADSWVGRDQLEHATLISAYGPLYDVDGQRIGLLHVAFAEQPFLEARWKAAAWLLALFLFATGLAAWIAVRGVRTVFKPIERMTAVVRATADGADRRIGKIDSQDEIGELARQFDAMLDHLQEHHREIEQAATVLERKVAARTQQLAKKNVKLQETVELLERTREQLILAEKLSALGQMAAGIAHEINNPAAVILGNLELLAAELGEAARPVGHEIDLIAQQVERIRHIVTGLLQFARAGPADGSVEEVDANRLVKEVLPLVEYGLRPRGIHVATALTAQRIVTCNLFDLQQVLINLIVNAGNAVADGGHIDVRTRDAEEGGVVIEVQDDGAGIPEDQLQKIFDPFFTRNPQRGVGLGLSVSYGLVRRHGGRITVASRVGVGTTFEVWLPERATHQPAIDKKQNLTIQEMSYDDHFA
ncbi:MAG: HAMP domain-containing protein [Pseudomonadota bacterium]|nr:MAG: HAMP domain-containing protein [Pseudomonadota bacterium]